ncbi:toll/interleukin-1 receptor domain-containing protein [Rhizobium mongolense]|uniref:Small-conductance mechanosensitive channel n=2 Tax=Rhizobium mongolense TaxID=57676 RepID=A0ABR6IW91_9HYPH|nr:toll/interleukin-1 receptor domain-containing protein [Rhizobium mongolense]MBB4232185.1 small-conductance mechanosensitive channel [Rhizobium mongolense]TVZ63095.1 TIR domain-containing protein [Rhizobium mongolense USDA 1844]
MSISSIHSGINRLQNQLADLRKKDAQEAKKELDAQVKANRASMEAGKTKSLSTMQSKRREAENAQKDATAATTKRAAIAKDIANKNAELLKAQTALSKEEEKERVKVSKEIERKQAEQLRRQKDIDNRVVSAISSRRVAELQTDSSTESFDVFISHASEDKEELVHELAEKSTAAGLSVFYDAKSIQWGESLRERIEHGLANSSFAVVVLSEAFFKKEWPKRELDGLFGLEMDGRSRILPIWHKISKDEVLKNAPTLAGKLALTTASLTVDEIVEKLVEIVKG